MGSTFDYVTFSFKECQVSQVLLPSRGISKVEWLMDSAPSPHPSNRDISPVQNLRVIIDPMTGNVTQ